MTFPVNTYRQDGPLVHRILDNGTLETLGEAPVLRRHIRRASAALDDTGDPEKLCAWLRGTGQREPGLDSNDAETTTQKPTGRR